MEAFVDEIEFRAGTEGGTEVVMTKRRASGPAEEVKDEED